MAEALTPQMSELFTTDKQIYCEQTGQPDSTQRLIMLHGLASNATRWNEFMQHTSLQQSWHLLAMNLRGHGPSMTFQRYTRQNWCNDILPLLAQENTQAVIAGHSMGAQIALTLAAQQAANLNGLILIDPVFPQALSGVLKKVARFRQLINIACWLLRGWYRLGLHKRNYPYLDLQKLDQQTRQFLEDNPDKGIADLYMNPFSDLAFIPLANYLQDLYEVTRALPPLDTINVPVLVLLSDGASTSHVETNQQILQTIPAVEIQTIDADHWLLTEKPVEARKIIEQWCQKLL